MNKILVIQTAFIGDAVLTLPMIQELKKKNRNDKIDVLTIPDSAILFQNSPFVNGVIVFDKKSKDKGIRSLIKVIRRIRSKKYNSVISPHRSFRSGLIAMFSGAKTRISFSNSQLKSAYNKIVPYRKEYHEVQRNLSLIDFTFKEENWKIRPEFLYKKEYEENVKEFLKSSGFENKNIAVAPGSIWFTKRYPAERYVEVIEFLIKNNFNVFLIGGKSDEDLCNGIQSEFNDNVYSVAGKFNLMETIMFLRNMELLISNDSAPTHLGVSAGIKVLTLYCSTVPDFGFYPYNNGSLFLSFDDLNCKPCGIHGHNFCPLGTFDCANKLTSEFIIENIIRVLNDNKRSTDNN